MTHQREGELREQEVIAYLAEARKGGRARGGVSLREIAHEMGLKHQQRRELKRIVEKLKRKREIEEVRQGRYRLAGERSEKSAARPEESGRAGQVRTASAVGHRDEKGETLTRGDKFGRESQGARQAGSSSAPLPSTSLRPSRTGKLPHSKEGRVERQPRPQGRAEAGATKRDPNLILGRLVAHRDGFGFVVPEERVAGMEGDVFLPPNALGDAMHGDRVAARIEKRGGLGRFEGRVVKILRRAHPRVVGIFRYGARGAASGNRVIPFEGRIGEIVIPAGEELTPQLREKIGASQSRGSRAQSAHLPELDGAVVNVELTRYPRGGVVAAGRVMEILGRPGELGVDVEIVIRKHHLPNEFPEEVMEEALAVPPEVDENEWKDTPHLARRDFRALPIVTIDGETAKDFDDAVYVERLGDGRWELQVHIADVAQYVKRGSALDREARVRGTSVYFPDRAVPMLPEALSNGICSLRPEVDRLVISVLMELDEKGTTTRAEFTPGVIRSVERMTYTKVNQVLEGDAEMTERYAPLAERFRKMKELALILNAKRTKRGSIDFDLPEPVIEFDELGRMQNIGRSERNIAHRIIEEFMLAANEAVASYLEKRGIASLHRAHEKPDTKKVLEFEELARAFGYTLGVADLVERKLPVRHGKAQTQGRHGRTGGARMRDMSVTVPAKDIDIRPQHYQNLVRKIEGKPEERILSYLMLRSLKQAKYEAAPLGHFALACDEYTHFTSPIRRYPDLIVHRVLKWVLEHPDWQGTAGKKSRQDVSPAQSGQTGAAEGGPYRMFELEEIAAESSDAERRAQTAERELMDWKTAQFMEEHLGEEYEALIISVLKFGFFVELMEVFVEGLVPMGAIEEFAGERCLFREGDRTIVTSRGRRAFKLGDRVRVRADRIEPMNRRVEFSLIESGEGSRRPTPKERA